VTIVVTHKGCNPVTFEIHAGYACDNASTYGGIWDRNGSITGATVCDASKMLGTLTYTRSGSNPALAWTVGDHAVATDVTYPRGRRRWRLLHVLLMDGTRN
jgi:hypothetical protein